MPSVGDGEGRPQPVRAGPELELAGRGVEHGDVGQRIVVGAGGAVAGIDGEAEPAADVGEGAGPAGPVGGPSTRGAHGPHRDPVVAVGVGPGQASGLRARSPRGRCGAR